MDHKLPQHIVIVMDGNGRWAELRGLPRIEGHKAGVKAVKEIIQSCIEKGIKCVSLFAFSSENWARPADEVNFLMGLFLEAIRTELNELNQNGICMRFTGDRSQLSSVLQDYMNNAEALTRTNQQLILNVVMNYGGKWDIVTAAKKMTQAVIDGDLTLDDVNDVTFERFLATDGLPEPDLFIRTSGELRISNFFLWQLAYTELYFTDVLWPDFDAHELDQALDSFGNRKRRFGQVFAKQ